MMKSLSINRSDLLSTIICTCLSAVVISEYVHNHDHDFDVASLQERLKEQYDHSAKTPPHHLGPPMGVRNRNCDDGEHGIETDWDPLSDEEYTCLPSDHIETTAPSTEIDEPETNGPVYHVCLDRKIIYNTPLPLSGDHRPLWPRYGEYIYLPPQRWVHTVEHGGIVLLYHPCMSDSQDLIELKEIVGGCLRKHVITPYRKVPHTHPFAILTYKHGLLLSHFDGNDHLQYKEVVDFITKYAQKSPESKMWKDGQYSVGLLYPAKVVSDEHDSTLCPYF